MTLNSIKNRVKSLEEEVKKNYVTSWCEYRQYAYLKETKLHILHKNGTMTANKCVVGPFCAGCVFFLAKRTVMAKYLFIYI